MTPHGSPHAGGGGGGCRMPPPPRAKASVPTTGGSLTSVTVMVTVAGAEREAVGSEVVSGRRVHQVGRGPAQGAVGGAGNHGETERIVVRIGAAQRERQRVVLGHGQRLGVGNGRP